MNASIQRCFVQGLFLWSAVRAFESHVRSPLTRPRPKAILHRAFHEEARLLQIRQSSQVFLSGDPDGEAPTRRRKRVKRKEMTEKGGEEEEEAEEIAEISAAKPSPIPEFKPRQDGPVKMQVRDVRNLVSGGGSSASGSARPVVASFSSGTDSASSSRDSLSNDSLRMLLEDAKELQALEAKKGSSGVPAGNNEQGFSMPDSFRSILSTIVTVDFFVVCGFLLWFLAGIFCSYILKDDTVQIAFNQLFQPVVQPALGILMIGAIAGSIGNEEE